MRWLCAVRCIAILLKVFLRVRSQYVYGQTDEESFLGLGLFIHAPIGVFLVAPMASNHGLCGRGSSNEKKRFSRQSPNEP